MKVRDIVEYGMTDEPAPGMSKARVRQDVANVVNSNRRIANRAQNANDETSIAQSHAARAEKRKRTSPTGIPSRLLNPQPAPQEPQQ